MLFKCFYKSPFGKLVLIGDSVKVKFLGFLDFEEFEGEKLFVKDDLEVFIRVKFWLDSYFEGKMPPICKDDFEINGSDYKKLVLSILCDIPYGKTFSYSDVSNEIKFRTGRNGGARAVGKAIHDNPIAVIIPCHRVVGKNGSLTGYRYGLNKKISLLEFEGVDMSKLYLPRVKE